MGIEIHEAIKGLGERIRMARDDAKPTKIEKSRRLSKKKRHKSKGGITQEELLKLMIDKYDTDSKGITQEELLQRMIDMKPNAKGVRRSISDWEYGNKKPSLENLLLLCNALGVSAGYLLGEYKEHDYSLHYICEQTGLSENAIKKIKKIYQEKPGGKLICYYLSEIVEHDDFENFIVALIEFIDEIFCINDSLTNSQKVGQANLCINSRTSMMNCWNKMLDEAFVEKGAHIYEIHRDKGNYTLPSKK